MQLLNFFLLFFPFSLLFFHFYAHWHRMGFRLMDASHTHHGWLYTFIVIFNTFKPISGVATLSITDSSATSSEDASNPDSPYNSSNTNELLQQHINDARHSKQNQQVLNNNNNNKNTKQVSVKTIHNFPNLFIRNDEKSDNM